MSSISSFTPQTTAINFMGPDKYRLTNQDADGDGVTDGKSLSGDTGKVINEGDLNQILAAHGLKASSGQFQSIDGFNLGSTNTSAVTNFGGPPALPDVGGASTPTATVGDRAGWLEVTQGLDDAALMWMALSTMAHTSMRDMKDAKMLKNALQKGKLEAKKNEIKSSEEKIAAERKAAVSQFAWAVAGAVVSFAAAWGGSSMQDKGEGKMHLGAGLSAAGQGLGSAVTAFGNMQNKTDGPQAEADEKQFEAMRWQMQQEMMDMGIEDAKAGYDEAKELFKLALKIMSEHVERQSQVVQTITRG